MKRSTWMTWAVPAVVVLLSALAGVFLVRQVLPPEDAPQAPQQQALAPVQQEFQLYFVSADGTYLQAENRQLDACHEENSCVQRLLTALIAGPQTPGLVPVLPAQTRILDVHQENDLVVVNLSRELLVQHPGGTLSELLTVYGVTNTVAVNFPYLRQLKFLVEGQPVATLKGHVSLDQPVMADFAYSRAPGAVRPAVDKDDKDKS
jgi:spore germination protein GerM